MMRTNLVWMVGAAMLACAADRASAQYGQGYWYPQRPAYQQWPGYPHWPAQAPAMSYPQHAAAWYPPPVAQPAYMAPLQPAAAPVMPATEEPAAALPEAIPAPSEGASHSADYPPPEDECPPEMEGDEGTGVELAAAVQPPPVRYAPHVTREYTQNIIFTEDCESGWRSGVSVAFLRPYYERNPAFTRAIGIGTANPRTVQADFDYDREVTLQSWIGYTFDGGVGFRGRYFNLDQDAHDIRLTNTVRTLPNGTTTVDRITQAPDLSDPRNFSGNSLLGSPGLILTQGLGTDQLRFSSDLRIRLGDAELTKEMDFGCLTLVLTGGGRYAQIGQHYRATQSNSATVAPDPVLGSPGGQLAEAESVNFKQTYHGGGPTVSIQGHSGIGCGGFALFGSARGSLLAGISRQDFRSTQVLADPAGLLGGDINGSDSNSSRQTDVLPIGELEVGLEYGCDTREVILFARVSAVHQLYWGLGSASSPDSNLSLFGLQVSAGFGF